MPTKPDPDIYISKLTIWGFTTFWQTMLLPAMSPMSADPKKPFPTLLIPLPIICIPFKQIGIASHQATAKVSTGSQIYSCERQLYHPLP